ncbi:MAG: carboxy terminal-processing peptidase [Bacteroidota bacterium]
MKRNYPILIVVLAAVGLMAMNVFPRITTESKEEVLMQTVVQFLARYHYSPSEIDDEFSRNVFTTYLNDLDGARLFFTQKDIDALEMHRLQIDDQAKAGQYDFFEAVGKHWDVSRTRSQEWYRDFLAQPLDFSDDESFERLDDDDKWLADEAALQNYWQRYLERDVLGRIVNRQEQLRRDTTGAEVPSFTELEEEYRSKVLENFDDWFQRMERMSRETRVSQYLNTMTTSHDPHTSYYAPRERENFDIRFRGRLEGIGATLTLDDDYTKVTSIVVGGPAWKADQLKEDDLITAVRQDDQEEAVDVKGMNLDDVISMIRGPKGTTVHLTIRKPEGEIQMIQIERDVVVIDERFARSLIIEGENEGEQVGYIWLPSFYADFQDENGRFSAQDVAIELEKLKAVGVDGIILDLRSNGGGSLADVIDMSGFFIPEGPIVQVEGRGGRTMVQEDKDETVQYDGPLVVMVNQGSASASEILAAAMQDYQRAVIVGSQRTFGKGTVQRFFDLDRALPGFQELKPLGSMKLTTQKFFRVDGGSTQLRGVSSDIVLPDAFSYIESGEQRQDNPLAWTEIEAANYSQNVFRITPDMMNELRRRSEARTSENPVFASIDENAQRIRRQRDRSIFPLEYDAYLEAEQTRRTEAERYQDLFEKEVNSGVANLEVDIPDIEFDESRIARNEDFVSKVSRDVYIQESMNIVFDLIDLQSSIAASDN